MATATMQEQILACWMASKLTDEVAAELLGLAGDYAELYRLRDEMTRAVDAECERRGYFLEGDTWRKGRSRWPD